MDSFDIEKSLKEIEARFEIIEKNCSDFSPKQSSSKDSNPLPTKPKSNLKPMSGNWLGFVASVCFVLAAGFIVKLSIDSGWLTHEKQLGVATLFGIALFIAGIVISSADKIYASFLPAAGAAILYFTCFAAYKYYLVISFQTVIATTSIISGISIWFYIRFKHDIYAIIAALGAYLAPVVSGVESNAIFSLYYFSICSLNFATLAIWVQSRTLTMISAYLAISITAFVGLNLHQDDLIATALALNFIIYSIGTFFHTKLTHQELTEKEAWSFFPVLLIFYAMEYYYISRLDPTLASSVSVASAALLTGLYLSASNWFPDRQFNSRTVLFTFLTVVCFHSIYLGLIPLILRPWLFSIILVGFSIFHAKLCYKKASLMHLIPYLALAAIVAIEYLNILTHLVQSFSLYWAVVSWVSLASIWFILKRDRHNLVRREEYYYIALAAAHVLCMMSLYQLTIELGTLAVSSSWLAYVLLILSLSSNQKDVMMAKSVIIVLFFAAGKALLYDGASTPTIIRTLCLIVTGVVLYASGLVIRRMTQWKVQSPQVQNFK